MAHETVSIIIDKKHQVSPNPTTGHALYVLGGVQAGFDLFLEVQGKGDDRLIPNDESVIDLKNGEHFYSTQQVLNPGSI